MTKWVGVSAVTIALGLTLALISTARAQEPDVQIVALDCNGDPELVVIENLGEAVELFSGWQLQSDPPGSEVFLLTALGGLTPGAAVPIQSGPSASGTFRWSMEFVFRDNDPTDYARIVTDTGVIVHQVNCDVEVAPETSPTPSPQPSPTPSPEPSLPADVPNGGGPPPLAGNALLGAMTIFLGASVAAAGVVTGALSWLRLRSSAVVGRTATLAPEEAAADRRRAQPRGQATSRGEPISVGLGLALVGLLATGAVLLLLRRRGA